MIQERDREKERFAKEVLHLQYIYLDCRENRNRIGYEKRL